jgi:hypothetical protein
MLLSPKYNSTDIQYEFLKVRRVTTVNKKTGEKIDIQTGVTITDANIVNRRNLGDFSVDEVYGYQKMRDGLGNPVTTSDGRYVYKQVNLLGDGAFASEHYTDNRPSIYNNGSVKVEDEISDGDVINFYKPVAKAEKEVVPSQPVTEANKTTRIMSDADVQAYDTYLKKSGGILPKEFFTATTTFKEFYNPATGRREKAPQTSKWLLQNNGLYNLIDKDSGEIYITDVDLKTGMKTVSEPTQTGITTPFGKLKLKDGKEYLISDINAQLLESIGYKPSEIGKLLKSIC